MGRNDPFVVCFFFLLKLFNFSRNFVMNIGIIMSTVVRDSSENFEGMNEDLVVKSLWVEITPELGSMVLIVEPGSSSWYSMDDCSEKRVLRQFGESVPDLRLSPSLESMSRKNVSFLAI